MFVCTRLRYAWPLQSVRFALALLVFFLTFVSKTDSAHVARTGTRTGLTPGRVSGSGRQGLHASHLDGVAGFRSDDVRREAAKTTEFSTYSQRVRKYLSDRFSNTRLKNAYRTNRQSVDDNIMGTSPPELDVNSSADDPLPLEQNMSKAFEEFQLYYLEEVTDDIDEAFKPVLIFEKGSLVGPFEKNPSNFTKSSLQSADKDGWFTESTVRDRIAFQFHFDPDYLYLFRQLEVTGSDDSRIDPQVVDLQISNESGTGSFNIVYHCAMGKPGRSVISMQFLVTEGHRVTTAWLKECGQGRFEHMMFGFLNHQGDIVQFNTDGTYGNDERKTLEVGPMDSSIDLVAGINPPAANLDFLTPYVTSDNDEVYVTLRSTVRAGRFSSDVDTKFTILHECDRKSVANIRFTTAIPPWDNVTATWRKDCGGYVSQSLLVGTEGEDSFDVIQEGTILAEYKVTDSTTVDNVDNKVKFISVSEHSIKFYLTNADDTSDIHFQTITTTLSDPDVLSAYVGTDDTSSLNANGGILERDSVRTLLILFVCKQAGKSVVLITLPSVRYATAEFGFVKECDGAPMTYTHSGFLSTAGSLLDVILVLAFISGIALCVYTARKKNGARYQAVRTDDPASAPAS